MPKAFAKTYDLFIPIGAQCLTQDVLRHVGLLAEDGPWNWSAPLTEDAVYMRLDMLCNGFDNFFNHDDFTDKDMPDFPCGAENWHAGYPRPIAAPPANPGKRFFNLRTQTQYNHDFHEQPSFDEQFGAIRERYARRAERTLEQLRYAGSVCLFFLSRFNNVLLDLRPDSDEIKQKMAALREKYPGKTIDLIMLNHDSSMGDMEIRREVITPGVVRYLSNHDIIFPADTDDVRHYLKNGIVLPKSILHIVRQLALTDQMRMPV
ncbi:MAG: hypothetical protein LBB08_00660 [Rickettsiales bacterium]|nr:hypothetical protein [Rickettsiales bacterium]